MTFPDLLWSLAPALCFAYLVSISSRRHRRTGWVSCMSLWCAFAIILWMLSPSLADYLLLHAVALSSMRALFFHRSILPMMFDFALSLTALGAGYWAATNTDSVFLTVWSFFLVQAGFVAIRGCRRMTTSTCRGAASDTQQFEKALRNAEETLRLLTDKKPT
ncbi:MAG: hypothetical protein HKN42_00930 [Granulosicoccus sp.]|nr:hypothetical protein [Granulosicoccus sp.]